MLICAEKLYGAIRLIAFDVVRRPLNTDQPTIRRSQVNGQRA